MKKINIPKNLSYAEIKKFFLKKNLSLLVDNASDKETGVNNMILSDPFKPDLKDLYRLYQFIILNKRTTILEFGSGWSSLIFSIALKELKQKYKSQVLKLRRNNPFELFILENDLKFLNISKKRIKLFKETKPIKIHYKFSEVVMTTYRDHISTKYKNLPTCNPDFIYLDGPDQFNIRGNINNFSTRHKDLMPMSCDILRIEYFLTPGTIIVCDGRSANANFLRDNFKRNWIYNHDKFNDQHIFYLNDKSLGKYNDLQLKFYKS